MDDPLRRARERLVEALGSQSAFWGLGRTTGELYAVLYLADEPLSLAELAAALGVTKGAVSLAIRNLERLGMVRRRTRPGDRRAFFEAERDFWRVAQRVLERRQKPEFDESFRLVEEGLTLARAAAPGPARDLAVARLEALKSFYDELDAIVAMILRAGPRRLARLLAAGARLLGVAGGDGGERA